MFSCSMCSELHLCLLKSKFIPPSSSVLTFLTLPDDIKYKPLQWNTTTHGNTSFVLLLHVSRWANYYLGFAFASEIHVQAFVGSWVWAGNVTILDNQSLSEIRLILLPKPSEARLSTVEAWAIWGMFRYCNGKVYTHLPDFGFDKCKKFKWAIIERVRRM